MILFLSFLACLSEPPPHDALSYVENRCEDIADENLKGECLVFEAMEIGYPSAEKSCHLIENPNWRAECFFLLADSIPNDLDETRRLCDRSEFLRNRCLSHWIRHQIKESLYLNGVDLVSAAETAAAQIVGQEAALAVSQRTLIELLAKSVVPPFSESHCQGLEYCSTIYLEATRQVLLGQKKSPELKRHCKESESFRLSILPIDETNPPTMTVFEKAWGTVCSSSL